MKRCPTCLETYADQRLRFCRRDGAALVVDSAAPDSRATLLKLDIDAVGTGTGVIPTSDPHPPVGSTTSSLLTTTLGRKRRPSRSKVIDSLAVLPLLNASREQDMEYLSDGITESIINSLSQLPKLRVVPRSTVFRYKESQADPLEIGGALDVRAILTGRVLQVANLLIVKIELIDVLHNSHLWGEEYRRAPGDIFAIQEDISREISAKLRLRLSGDLRKRLVKRYTENTEAYHAYLRGRYYTNKRTTEWINKGINNFQQAIESDPNYALAYTGLADAYALLASSTGERRPVDWYPKARAAAFKALELDDGLAEAHTSLGFCRLLYDWDLAAAGREFKRAIDLDPNCSNAHDGYSFYFKATGQHEKAIAACLRAQSVEPLSLFASVSLGWAYYFARRYELVVEQARKTLEMDPQFTFAFWSLGMAYAQMNEANLAIDAFERAHTISGGGLTFKAHLGYAHALAGNRQQAMKIISEMEGLTSERYVSSYYFAMIHMALGDSDRALSFLETAIVERSGFMAFIEMEPLLDPLRSNPRFAEIERSVRLSKAPA